MDRTWFEPLAPANLPEPWLAVIGSGQPDYVIGVARSEEALEIERLRKEWFRWINDGDDIIAMRDSPTLGVRYQGGLWMCGYTSATPAHLAARRNWFLRYRDVLNAHLSDPRPALVHFYESRPLPDLLCTMRSSKSGPFPFPRKTPWPACGHCGEQMAFIGVLDFREYQLVGPVPNVPKGSLVLHGCEQCGVASSDDSISITWTNSGQELDLRGRDDSEVGSIEVGMAYATVEFETPAYHAKELSDDPGFLKEWGICHNFACPLNKVGGQLQWIQSDETPVDRKGHQMEYIGQFISSRDVELGDSGIVYVFFSGQTKETKVILQYY